jgi:hypothetical protein
MLRKIVSGVTATVAVCATLSLADGCLDRPVTAGNPITRTNFLEQIQQSSIDKVDLLFDIDNSASMGDKQAYLKEAIPDLLGRLVMPNCVDTSGNPTGAQSDINGNCTMGNPEFSPVHDMHIGIVSSSLGPRLGGPDVCPTTATDPDMTNTLAWQLLAGGGAIDRHNDDQGHLLDRGSDPNNLSDYTETPLGAAQDSNPGGGNFLDWFPTSNMNNSGKSPYGPVYSMGPQSVMDPGTLNSDFSQLVVGVHQFGCGIESQLESWYRFLIQPDPYASLMTDSQGRAQWVGVDTTILAQRADFLRPDSLVAILVLSDENDSEVDVRAFSGSAWNFMSPTFPPPRGTSQCLTNPADPDCTSCEFPGHSNDPECLKGNWPLSPPGAPNWGGDLNLRHVHEKLKYGVDVQFPIERYLVGLTSTRVPNRDGEYPPDGNGGYASSYQGLVKSNQNCTNPLFAKTLPSPPNGNLDAWNPQWSSGNPPADPNNDLCNMSVGGRQPNLVFYAHIGGVPHQLLQNDPTKMDTVSQSQKATLTPADWTLILGNDPENYDYTGIDPHMIESYQDRSGAAVPPNGNHVAAPSSPEGTDPISGREWVTDSTMAEHTGLNIDREYACIFPLQTVRLCDPASVAADPTLNESCDCLAPVADTGSFTHEQVPAVCNDATPTRQDSAKAYPTIRELLLAKLMGQQGVVSSLCPIHTMDNAAQNDPLYGYRPAMNAIVNALKNRLGITCLPQPLSVAPDPVTQKPSVQCLILGTFPSGPGQPTSCGAAIAGGGWSNPDPTILKHFQDDQTAGWQASGSPGTDPALLLTCQLQQLPPDVNCSTRASGTAAMPADGWCYFQNPSLTCAQAILFSANAQIDGVVTSLQCLEQAPSVIDAGGAGH